MFSRRLVFYFFILIMLASQQLPLPKAEATNLPLPKVFGNYATIIDANTGEVIYSKQARTQWYPASLTKILTAMLLLDSVEKGTLLTASANAVKQDVSNSVFLLKVGEKMSREDALKALLVMSSNDVATMIAEHIAGSEGKFSTLMNKKAREIGAKQSHFMTPSGLHHPKHVTTSYDMALITREALKNYPEVINTMGMKSTIIHTSKRTVKLTNRAQFFTKPDVLGGKTGYTNAARNSLVEIIKKGDTTLIGVVMKSSKIEQYKDLTNMSKYSFSSMHKTVALKQGQVFSSIEFNGEIIPLVAKETVIYSTKRDSKIPFRIKESIYPPEVITSIVKGHTYGEITVWRNGIKIGSTPLVASKSSD